MARPQAKPFRKGFLKNVLIVAALAEEFPFADEFNVLYTGVGKVNATLNLCSFLMGNENVKTVINVGSAGGINYKKNSIVQCEIFLDGQLDYPGYVEEKVFFSAGQSIICTFDNFIKDKPKKICDCVDMESFALAKVCKKLSVNFLCFKFISDIIGEDSQEGQWVENYKEGKYLLRETVRRITSTA